MSIKRKSIHDNLEEFCKGLYAEEIFKLSETYPDNTALEIDYSLLENVDMHLADLLTNHPEEIIEATENVVKKVDPFLKGLDIDIKFENVPPIRFEMLHSKYIGEFVCLDDVIIMDVKKPHPTFKTKAFECTGCMRIYEVDKIWGGTDISEPHLCTDCGGRSFRVSRDYSTFIDEQIITVGVEGTSRKLIVYVYGNDCSYDDYHVGDHLSITGVLKICESNNHSEYYFDCNNIKLLSETDAQEVTVGDRNSPEYKIWQQTIIDNDKVCACCGGHKHLHAHHIFGYKNNPSYRLNPENGIVLCKWCHGKYHSYYGKDANPKNLIKFLKRFGVK